MAAPALSTPFQPYVFQSPQGAVTAFQIFGGEAQVVQIMLKPQEKIQAKPGDVCFTSSSIQAEVPQENAGILQWLVGKPDTVITYTNVGTEDGFIGLGGTGLSRVLPIDLSVFGGEITCQREAFLASLNEVVVKTQTPRRARGVHFGAESLFTQKLTGSGLALLNAGGSVLQKKLNRGESIVVDISCVIAMTSTVECDIKQNGSARRGFFGGEGPFQAHLSGPGLVFIQSLPPQRLAHRIARTVTAPHFRDNPRIFIFCLFFLLMAYVMIITSLILSET